MNDAEKRNLISKFNGYSLPALKRLASEYSKYLKELDRAVGSRKASNCLELKLQLRNKYLYQSELLGILDSVITHKTYGINYELDYTPIYDQELGLPYLSSFYFAKIDTLELFLAMSEKDILNLKGMDPYKLKEIKEKVEAYLTKGDN